MFSVNTQKNYIYLLIAALIGLVVAAAVYDTTLFAAVVIVIIVFVIFVKNPELALAILFNGTLIYFYVVYKLGFQTSRTLTGGFYGFLAYSFLLAEVLLLSKKHINFRLSFVDILFLIFFSLFFLSYLAFSTDNDNAYSKIIYAPLLAIAPYLGARLLLSERRIKNFFKYSVFIAAMLMIPAFYELFTRFLAQRPRFSMYFFENANAAKDNPILFGSTYATLLIIIFVWAFECARFRLRYFVPVAISAYFVLLSGSRGVMISFVAAIIFYLFVVSKKRLRTKIYASIFMLLMFFSVYKLFIPQRLDDFYKYSLSANARQDTTSSIQIRTSKWERAICDFAENPIIGVGTGNSDNRSGYPHNIVLEVAAEFGVLGLFVFALLCYTVVRKATIFLKNKQLSNSHMLMRLLLVLFIYMLTHAMFSGYIANHVCLYICMGLIVCLDNLQTTLPVSSKISPE